MPRLLHRPLLQVHREDVRDPAQARMVAAAAVVPVLPGRQRPVHGSHRVLRICQVEGHLSLQFGCDSMSNRSGDLYEIYENDCVSDPNICFPPLCFPCLRL